jgi:hypothetical protein
MTSLEYLDFTNISYKNLLYNRSIWEFCVQKYQFGQCYTADKGEELIVESTLIKIARHYKYKKWKSHHKDGMDFILSIVYRIL